MIGSNERERFIFRGKPGNGTIHRIIWIEGGIITTWTEINSSTEDAGGWTWSGPLDLFRDLFVKI